MDNREIGNNIKKHRKQQKLTQKQLGELIGKTESSIQKYESGETEAPLSVLELIAGVLNLDILDILNFQGALNWYSNYDNATMQYFESIGYRLEYKNDYLIIYHNGYGYKVPEDLFFKIQDDLRIDAEYGIKKVIEKYAETKFIISVSDK